MVSKEKKNCSDSTELTPDRSTYLLETIMDIRKTFLKLKYLALEPIIIVRELH